MPSDSVPGGARMCNICYCFAMLGFLALIMIITWGIYGSLIDSDLSMLSASVSRHKSAIFDIASWASAMLLSGCIVTTQVAPLNSKARKMAKCFSLVLGMVLLTIICAMLYDFLTLPVVCIAWLITAINFIGAWRGAQNVVDPTEVNLVFWSDDQVMR